VLVVVDQAERVEIAAAAVGDAGAAGVVAPQRRARRFEPFRLVAPDVMLLPWRSRAEAPTNSV
jgi:hypothetical protein